MKSRGPDAGLCLQQTQGGSSQGTILPPDAHTDAWWHDITIPKPIPVLNAPFCSWNTNPLPCHIRASSPSLTLDSGLYCLCWVPEAGPPRSRCPRQLWGALLALALRASWPAPLPARPGPAAALHAPTRPPLCKWRLGAAPGHGMEAGGAVPPGSQPGHAQGSLGPA